MHVGIFIEMILTESGNGLIGSIWSDKFTMRFEFVAYSEYATNSKWYLASYILYYIHADETKLDKKVL